MMIKSVISILMALTFTICHAGNQEHSKPYVFNDLIPGLGFWNDGYLYFLVPASERTHNGNIVPVVSYDKRVFLGAKYPNAHGMLELASGMPAKIFHFDFKNRKPIKFSGIEKYQNIFGSDKKSYDVYYCGNGCAEKNLTSNDAGAIDISIQPVEIDIWNDGGNALQMLSRPDLRVFDFPAITQLKNKEGKILWQKTYLLKTAGEIEDRYGNRGFKDVVVGVSHLAYYLPGDKYFYISSHGDGSVHFSSITARVDLTSGDVEKNSRFIAVDMQDFLKIIEEYKIAMQLHYSKDKYQSDPIYIAKENEDCSGCYVWQGDYYMDAMEFLNFKLTQAWFKNLQ